MRLIPSVFRLLSVVVILPGCCGVAFAQKKVKVEELYATYCASCHGAKLEGGQASALVDGKWQHGSSDEDLTRAIAKGLPELGMPPMEDGLSADQIRALVIFMREKEKQALLQGIELPKPTPKRVTKTELHDYRIEVVVESGLSVPWAIAFLPDGRKLVTEKAGRLRFLGADGRLDPTPIAGLPHSVDHGQGGLMEVALHPDYERNGWVYLGFADGEPGDRRCITAVVRGRIKDHQWMDQEWIFRADPKFRGTSGVHFGTRFVFDKGYLYFVVGERGGFIEAQDLSRPNGKIHRLHDDGRVPQDNPFVGDKNAMPSIWSYGHRNPQGLARDPRDGALYCTEHGPRGGDELNLVLPGRNYGWPIVTLGMHYDGTPMNFRDTDGTMRYSVTEKEGMEPPVAYWVPSVAVCGLDFYTGDKFPEWKNDLFSGGLAQQEVRRIRLQDRQVVAQEIILKDIGRVRDVAAGPDGFLYVLLNGPDRIVRLVPAGE